MRNDGVLILAGSTASGKTQLAIELAREFDAEIVGADSRQIYRAMPIGTAAPSPQQLAAVPHHLFGFLDPGQRYSAAQYVRDAMGAIDAIHQRGRRAIVVGGTGFYIRALTGGVVLAPQYDQILRDRLANEVWLHPPEFLHGWLALRDPERARKLGAADTYRVVRSLEIALAPAVRPGGLRTLNSERLSWVIAFLDLPWSVVDARIASRTKAMLGAGLLEEAERIGCGAVAANAVGYPQALAYLQGWCTLDELVALLERATRRYARRQRAWFRNEPATLWLRPDVVSQAVREKLGWYPKRK